MTGVQTCALPIFEKQKRDFTYAESDLEEAALWREKISGTDAK